MFVFDGALRGEADGDRRSLSGLADDFHGSPMEFRQGLCQGQPQPGSFVAAQIDVADLTEGFENPGDVFRLDADARMPMRDLSAPY